MKKNVDVWKEIENVNEEDKERRQQYKMKKSVGKQIRSDVLSERQSNRLTL